MSIIFLHLRLIFGRYRRNTHVTELACLGPHQHVCLGLPPSGCFSRWWDDFAHWINQYVPPTEPEGNHHSPLPGTYSNLLPSVCSKQGTDQSDFFRLSSSSRSYSLEQSWYTNQLTPSQLLLSQPTALCLWLWHNLKSMLSLFRFMKREHQLSSALSEEKLFIHFLLLLPIVSLAVHLSPSQHSWEPEF